MLGICWPKKQKWQASLTESMSQEWSSLPLQGGTELLAQSYNVFHDQTKPVPGIIAAGTLLCQGAPLFKHSKTTSV